MFPKDPKKPAIDAASMMKDEAIKRAMDAAKSQATERIQGDGYTIYKTDGLASGFDLNDYNPEEAQSALLSKLGLNPNPSGLVFTCKIGLLPTGTLQVIDFNLTEGLSSLFSLSINAVSFLPFIDFQAHLGAASSLTVKRDGKIIRTVNGILSGAIQGNTDGVKTWYHFEIRPEMWVMTLNQDSRIFQDQTAPTILKTLLDEAHVKSDCKFYRQALHPERLYTTQKRESAYDFWCRLAFEEGINFWFEENQMFYSDEYMGMTAGIDLTYNPQSETDITDSTVMTWQYGEYLCADEIIQKDNNYVRPSYPLTHQQKSENGGQHSVFESYGRFQLDAEGEPLTKVRLEQLRSGSRMGHATSNCFALRPGKIFTLDNHPHAPMNDHWQVVSVQHRGVQPLADNSGGEGTQLSNTVSFIPGYDEWRPPHRYKPTADGDELATVVGPPGEEIYTNEYGAVKVHFHWDRYGKPDHSASCWVRVAMGWSGGGYGFSAVPRVNTVVQVSYLNGDIDRPIVTGCTYDGRNATPSDFPTNKTRTTFRSKTHKGEGFNELRFEDENGKQEVFIHAQKDMNTKVLNDQTLTVLNNKTKNVVGNEENTIEGYENTKVVVAQDIAIKGNSTLLTGGYRKDQAVGRYFIGSGESIRLECGESVLELSASGAINLKGKSFNITVDNTGQINTKGGVLGLNPSSPSPTVSPDGTGNKGALQSTINNVFADKG